MGSTIAGDRYWSESDIMKLMGRRLLIETEVSRDGRKTVRCRGIFRLKLHELPESQMKITNFEDLESYKCSGGAERIHSTVPLAVVKCLQSLAANRNVTAIKKVLGTTTIPG
jgi:hypothetical protein